jgi:single-strand DNA-binding protein
MSSSFNSVTVVGHLGRDPEPRYTPSGDQVTSFSVATSERYKTRDGQQQERTTWFTVSAWGKLAETCGQYLHKGSYVYVEGPVSLREYTDRDGVQRASLDVRAREMRMLDSRAAGQPAMAGARSVADDLDMDSVPF